MKSTEEITDIQIDTLGYFVDRALGVMVKKLNKTFTERNIDLQHSQYTILKVLWCKDGLSQSQLSKILGKDPAAICRALNYLEQKGYIVRKSRDSKTNGVYLTEYASVRKDDIEQVADFVTESATEGMTEHQRNMTTQLLTRIYNNLK